LFSNIISTELKTFSYGADQGPRNHQTHTLPAVVLAKNGPGAKNKIWVRC